jgi:localization factor PodJL
MGQIFAHGTGVGKDAVEAYKWYMLAADQSHDGAIIARDALAKTMKPEELARAKVLATEWKPVQVALPSGAMQ